MKIQIHRDTNRSSWSLQAPACGKSLAGAYCDGQVLFLQLSLGCWATDPNRKHVAETDGPWSDFIRPLLEYFYVHVFSKSVQAKNTRTQNTLFQRVNMWSRRNWWYFVQHCQPWAAYTPGTRMTKQKKNLEMAGTGEEVYFANFWQGSQFVFQILFP